MWASGEEFTMGGATDFEGLEWEDDGYGVFGMGRMDGGCGRGDIPCR